MSLPMAESQTGWSSRSLKEPIQPKPVWDSHLNSKNPCTFPWKFQLFWRIPLFSPKIRMANQSKKNPNETVLISPPGGNTFLRNHVKNAPGRVLQGSGCASAPKTPRAHSQPCRKLSPTKLVTYYTPHSWLFSGA